MSNPIKYAVEPMFDFEKDSNEVLGYIVSKCLVMKSYIDYEEDDYGNTHVKLIDVEEPNDQNKYYSKE